MKRDDFVPNPQLTYKVQMSQTPMTWCSILKLMYKTEQLTHGLTYISGKGEHGEKILFRKLVVRHDLLLLSHHPLCICQEFVLFCYPCQHNIIVMLHEFLPIVMETAQSPTLLIIYQSNLGLLVTVQDYNNMTN